jgi:DNA-binding HxlR family transcriptional regulator
MDTMSDLPKLPDLRKLGGADAYLRTCPSRTVLDLLANKWVTLIVPALRGGPMRFGELRRRLDGITQKSLTQALRALERDGLIIRTVYPTIPPRVDYALTDLGRNASGLLGALCTWAEQHIPDIVAARTSYDERPVLDTPPRQVPVG